MVVRTRAAAPWILMVALVLTLGAPGAPAQQTAPSQPEAWAFGLTDLTSVGLLGLDALNPGELIKQDAGRELDGLPWRFAVPKDVAISPDNAGTWEGLPDGRMLWRLHVAAAGATSLSLGFGSFALPEHAWLWIYAADGSQRIRPFSAADMDDHGQLWTPAILGDGLVIELSLRPEDMDQVSLVLSTIGQGYRGFGKRGSGSSYASGSCNVDVVCPEGDDWFLEIPASGAMQIGASWICSGSLVNDTATSLKPYFLTANHCGVSAGNAASLVVYWNYENSFCRAPGSAASGGPGDGSLSQFNSGAIWRAAYAPSDFTLVEFDDDPDEIFAVSWAGWDRSGVDAAMAVAVHHPGVQEKRISFEFQPTSVTSYLGNSVPGDGTHVRVEDWDLGTTEGGSSGSPLFDQNHRIIGQLHGGFASCSSQTSDWYGRLAVSWTGGGSPSTRLSNWLDPGNTGALFVDSISLDTLCDDAGTIALGAGSYGCSSSASITVVDCGLDTNELLVETVSILVTSPSEPGGESVLLTETGPGSAKFTGTLTLGAGGAGVLAVTEGELISASYLDADDGLGGFNVLVTAHASIDCTAPVLSGAGISAITPQGATVSFSADEPVFGSVLYGTSCGSLGNSESASSASTSVSLALTGLNDETTHYLAVQGTDEAGNLATLDNGGLCFSFTTLPAQDYFTEQFGTDNDLDNRSVLLSPVGGQDFYSICQQGIGQLPTDPAGGTALSLTDDESEFVALSGGKRVLLYGVPYNGVYVCSNGYITLGQPDSDYDETLAEHFAVPRVAPLYDDLNPTAGGSVSYKQLADRFVVSWQGVPEFSTSNSNTFQVEMHFNGQISMSWLAIAATDGIAGVSSGGGLAPDFIEADLTGASGCGTVCQADLGLAGPGATTLSICGGDLSGGTNADLLLTGAEAGGTAWLVLSLSNDPTPFKGGQLVPVPVLLIQAHAVSGAGQVSVPGIPGGNGPLTVYAQMVSTDSGQTLGYGFSNALQVEFLP